MKRVKRAFTVYFTGNWALKLDGTDLGHILMILMLIRLVNGQAQKLGADVYSVMWRCVLKASALNIIISLKSYYRMVTQHQIIRILI